MQRKHLSLAVIGLCLASLAATALGFPLTSFVPPDVLAGLGALGMMPMVVGDTDVAVAEVKKTIEGIGTSFEQFKSANDARLKALEKGLPTGDLEAKLAKIEKDLTDFTEAKSAIEAIQQKLNRPGLDVDAARDQVVNLKSFNMQRKAANPGKANLSDIDAEVYVSYRKATEKMFREGYDALDGDERKSLQAGVAADGGYLLPAETTGRTVKKVYETSLMRQFASVQAISGQSIEGLIDNDQAETGWVGETQARTANDGTPQVGKWEIQCHEMYSQPKATQTLLDDASVDVEAWLSDKVAVKMARKENAAFCVGTGIAQPKGFGAYPTVATNDDARAWGTFEHILTGVNGDFGAAATFPQDKLIEIIQAMRPEYLANSGFYTRRDVITKIRKFKDGMNAYLWQPSLVLGQPDSLLAYPVRILPDMATLAAGSLSLAFGDMRETYLIVDRIGIRVIRDNLTSKPYIKFYTTKRVGGGVLNYESLKFLKFA